MNYPDSSRRSFLKKLATLSALFVPASSTRLVAASSRARPVRAEYMGNFAAPKIDTVRCAFIGVGERGTAHVKQLAFIEGTEVVAISDLYEDLTAESKKNAEKAG